MTNSLLLKVAIEIVDLWWIYPLKMVLFHIAIFDETRDYQS